MVPESADSSSVIPQPAECFAEELPIRNPDAPSCKKLRSLGSPIADPPGRGASNVLALRNREMQGTRAAVNAE